MNGKPLALYAIFSALFLVSCAVRTARVGEQPEMAETLLQGLNAYNGAVSSLEGKALVVYKEGDKVVSLKATIAADKAELKYRLELFDYVFNKHLASVLRNGDDVRAVLYFKKASYDISYEGFQFQEVTGIAIPKEILFRSMLGEVYVYEGETRVYTQGASSLVIETSNARETIIFNENRYPYQADYSEGKETFRVEFVKFKTLGRARFPVKISIEGEDRSLEINYTDVKLNHVLGAHAFANGGESTKWSRKAQ